MFTVMLWVLAIVGVFFIFGLCVGNKKPLESVICVRTCFDHYVPKRAKPGDAGFDLTCEEDRTIMPNEQAMISLGICMKVPEGSVGLLMPRSSLNKVGIHCYPGTIDSGYTGPMFALLRNTTPRPVEIKKGMRVCQLIPLQLFPVEDVMEEVDEMPDTARGNTGFGSTGDAVGHA